MNEHGKLCNHCPIRTDPRYQLTGAYRLWLFLLSATATVIIPAIMLSTFHTFETMIDGPRIALLLISILPLTIVLIVAFIGLYQSLFGGEGWHPFKHLDRGASTGSCHTKCTKPGCPNTTSPLDEKS